MTLGAGAGVFHFGSSDWTFFRGDKRESVEDLGEEVNNEVRE